MALPFENYTVATLVPPFLFWIFKGDLKMKAYAKFNNGFLSVRYILNGL